MNKQIALITIASNGEGPPVIASSGISKESALLLAHALSNLQAQLMNIALSDEPLPVEPSENEQKVAKAS